MKERPILFSGPMVQAILDGRKTQTRRVVKAPRWSAPDEIEVHEMFNGVQHVTVPDDDHADFFIDCPYGKPGDRLWVRETWRAHRDDDQKPPREITEWIIWEAANKPHLKQGKLRPSIFMPRWASRILLEITDVRVERLCEITEDDAIAEGLKIDHGIVGAECIGGIHTEHMGHLYYNGVTERFNEPNYCPVDCFADLWEHINGTGSWNKNPWVWVVEFKVVRVKQ